MGILIYAGLIFLLALAALKRQSRLLLILLQIQSFLFVFLFLWLTRANYQILQVRKFGYQFDKVTTNFRNPSRSILMGGDTQKDDIYLGDAPGGAIQLTPSLASGDTNLEVLSDGILLLRNSVPLNATYLKNGDRLSCGDQDFVFFSKGAFQRGFRSADKEWIWPRREWKIEKQKEPVLAANVDPHIHSIADISAAIGRSCNSKAAFTLQEIRLNSSRNPVELNAVFVIGAGNGLKINDAPVARTFTIHDGDALSIYEIRKGDRSAYFTNQGSFRVSNAESFDLLLSDPQVLGMKEELLRNGSAINRPLFLTTGALPYSVLPTARFPKESKRFSDIFAFIQTQQYMPASGFVEEIEQRFQRFFSLRPSDLEVVTDSGSFHPKYGERFTLGNSERMIFSIDRVDFPWLLLQALCILWLTKMLFQPPFFAAIENVAMQLLIITADFFLITRFLFSFRAASLYPFSDDALTLSLFAILIVPYLLFSGALLIRPSWERRQLWNFGSYTVIVCALAAILIPDYMRLTMSIALVFSSLAFLRFHPRSFLSHWKAQFEIFKNVRVEIALALFILIAAILQLFGTGEAIEAFGFRFPLALVYHPILLFFSAHYLNKTYQTLVNEPSNSPMPSSAVGILDPPARFRAAMENVAKLLLVLVSFLVIGLLTSDLGFFLLYCVPIVFILFGLAARFSQEYEMKWKAIGASLALPLVAFLVLFVGSSLVEKIVPVSTMGNRTIQRILLTINPTALEQSGLLMTERQLGHERTFVAYSHSGFFGGGFMNRPISAALSGTALNDNVTSTFLLNDFGICGFLAVLLVLTLWMVFWWKNHTTFNTLSFLSLAALITFVYVDFYMMLSNCGIFLFTGKNFFFWGLNSISDVFHSSLILFLITVKQR